MKREKTAKIFETSKWFCSFLFASACTWFYVFHYYRIKHESFFFYLELKLINVHIKLYSVGHAASSFVTFGLVSLVRERGGRGGKQRGRERGRKRMNGKKRIHRIGSMILLHSHKSRVYFWFVLFFFVCFVSTPSENHHRSKFQNHCLQFYLSHFFICICYIIELPHKKKTCITIGYDACIWPFIAIQ